MKRWNNLGSTCVVSCLLALSAGCAVDAGTHDEATNSVRQAVTTTTGGFVWASATTGSFPAAPNYSYNSSGGTNQITWLGTGSAQVDFPGIGAQMGGNVQVTAYGTGSDRCKVSGWGSVGSTLRASVLCFNVSGAPVSTLFTASYVQRGDFPGFEGGYVFADQPTTTFTYTPNDDYQWNSVGGFVTILRLATGFYRVTFPGQNFTGGTAEITAFGQGSAAHCKSGGWSHVGSDQLFYVSCFASGGAGVDSIFSAKFTLKNPNLAASYAYAYADQPSTASYQPNLNYQRVQQAQSCGRLNNPGNVTIARSTVGTYTVTIPGLASGSAKSHVKVTAYGASNDSSSCKVTFWSPSGSNEIVGVACYNTAGASVDSSYTVTFDSTVVVPC